MAKRWYKSKTLWTALLTTFAPVVGALYPPLAPFFPAALSVVGVVFGGLRLTTHSAVSLKKR